MDVPLHHVLPAPAHPTTQADAYAAPLGRHRDRPWVGLCMVVSLDGSTVVDGASAGLSSDNDVAVLLQLRSIADVVLVGAGTAASEGYGPPKTPGQRIAVVTGRGSVDTSSELFASGAGLVITTEAATFQERGVDVIRAGSEHVDLAAAIARIPSVCPGASFIQAEGGASLNGALSDADLIDEMNITTSPAAVGGDGSRMINGARDLSQRFHLEQMLVDDESFVFSRWIRRRTSP